MHHIDDDDGYVCSQIKPNWKLAYENENFGADFPVNAAPTEAKNLSALFTNRILHRIGSKILPSLSTDQGPLSSQRPRDPRIRRESQPVTTQLVPQPTVIQQCDADTTGQHRVAIDDDKRCNSDPPKPENDGKTSIDPVSLTQTNGNAEHIPIVDEQIDRPNEGIESIQMSSPPHNTHTEPDQMSSPPIQVVEFSLPLESSTPVDVSSESWNHVIEDEEVENVACDEIDIKDVVIIDAPITQNAADDDYSSDSTVEVDFESFRRLPKFVVSHADESPIVVDIDEEENTSPQCKVEFEDELLKEQSVQPQTESEESDDDDSQNDTNASLVPFFRREVRIILEDIGDSTDDFPINQQNGAHSPNEWPIGHKKKKPTRPLTPSDSEPEPNLNSDQRPANNAIIAEPLTPIEITSSDDEFVYELSSGSDSDNDFIELP